MNENSKKRRLWGVIIAVALIVVVVATFAVRNHWFTSNQTPITIAVTLPTDNPISSKEILNAYQMYTEQVNQAGGVNGHPVLIQPVYEADGGTESAQQIVADNQAVAVLGFLYSDPAKTTGAILKEAKIPAMTSAATDPAITQGNEWFFSVINNNLTMGHFLATYAHEVYGLSNVVIIYDNNGYGNSLFQSFQDGFSRLGGTVLQSYRTEPNSADLPGDAKKIVAAIKNNPDQPQAIFLATYRAIGAPILVELKRQGVNYPVIGDDDMSDETFLDMFKDQPEEQTTPGYFTDGLVAPAPLIYDLSGALAQRFRGDYVKRYHLEPTWSGATAYDSLFVVIEALRATGATGSPETLVADREKIRAYLASRNSLTNSFEGLTGQINFNQDRVFAQPMAMGLFSHGRFISAPVQFLPINPTQISDLQQQIQTGKVVRYLDQYCVRTNVVYVGLDINNVSNVDVESERHYSMDFYLWFRYQGDNLTVEDIDFPNAVDPVTLDQPIAERKIGAENYRAYRVVATFTNNFDLRDYPFDHQALTIQLRHGHERRENLMYVVDYLGMGDIITREHLLAHLEKNHAFDTVNDWEIADGQFFIDTISNYSTLGDPLLYNSNNNIAYSRFNTALEVKRDVFRFVVKNMLPVLFLIMLAYLGLFLPDNEFGTITGIMTGTVLSVVFFHVDLSNRLNVGYSVALDYAFYTTYALLVLELLISIVAWNRSEDKKLVSRLFWLMRVIYPLVILVGGAIFLHSYGVF